MFEGVVSQVLDGLLRRYVKGIQKEQLEGSVLDSLPL
jgi:hypothetical protein